MGLPVKPRYSIAEYLQRERVAMDRHEYRDGEIVLMAGGSGNHSLIVANVGGELRQRLKGSPCRAYDSNLRVRIPRTVLYTYPDVTVICGPREADPNDTTGETFTNPRFIVEVLSPSTEGYDRGEKFNRYLLLESLQELMFVTQETARVEVYFRHPDGTWLFSHFSGVASSAKLRSLNLELPLSEVYAGIDFPPGETLSPSSR